jgi:hypothetical protein
MTIQKDDPATDSAQDHRSVVEQSDVDVHMTDGWTLVHSKRLRKQLKCIHQIKPP